jgi:polyhydroxybutyrate depolymerase
MSNGGFMSYELACQLSGRIAAIASVTGSMIESRLDVCNSTHPTPVMQIHGTADPTVPYIGIPAQTMMHIDTLVKRWAELNSCDMTPTITQVPNISLVDGCTAGSISYLTMVLQEVPLNYIRSMVEPTLGLEPR